ISAKQNGETILSDPGSHRHPGMHSIHETTALGESPIEIQVTVQGLGHGDEITDPKGIVSTMTVVPELLSESESELTITLPVATGIHTVNIAEGSGTPGCENTDECYLPYSITISPGDTVEWNNIDSAAHTVTSGNISDGYDGVFDSGLFMSGLTFEFTFDETGTFDYFCMVHPWMTGDVIVNDVEEMIIIEESEPGALPESGALQITAIVSVPVGTAVPGCEDTNECYLPYEITVASGTTVSWVNDDSASHTVTSGTVDAGLTGVFDSGLFMSGLTFEFTFDEIGTFDYFCMVHPWMDGKVIVN
ncbi:MAG: plastocyanin/azurin family copper-binding protein, partial [Nitrosopumilus sp.]|nr:plastocyanin/azurin family copper-binding protein [Nitrosopumilus sp.]